MLFAPILAAVAALTVRATFDLQVERVYAPVVVGSRFELSQGHAGIDAVDVTPQQLEDAKAALVAAGFAGDRIEQWTQTASTLSMGAGRYRTPKNVKLGILLVDLGSPAEAPANAMRFNDVKMRGLTYGWDEFVRVDCDELKRKSDALLGAQARDAAAQLLHGKVVSLEATTDPATGTFDPVPMCPRGFRPLVKSSGYRPLVPGQIGASYGPLRLHVAANVRVAFDSGGVLDVPPPSDAFSLFPYTTFGAPIPIIGHQNLQFVLQGGRFAALPGDADVSAPVQNSVVVFLYNEKPKFEDSVKKAPSLGIAADDLYADHDAKRLYVRIHGAPSNWSATSEALWGGNDQMYIFMKDCAPYARYADSVALARSKRLAQIAATTLSTTLGPLIVKTDWAGPSTSATCGSDGSGDMRDVVKYIGQSGIAVSGEPGFAWFTSSFYAAWQLGPVAPKVISQSVVERLIPVIVGAESGEKVTGTATLTPDAYFVRADPKDYFHYTIVAKNGAPPKDAGNVITDCDGAQGKALSDALKVALLDHPVHSFYAQQVQFRSTSCLSAEYIGKTISALTLYNSGSATGEAQAEDTITVYP